MEGAILSAEAEVVSRAEGSVFDRVLSAWGALGLGGRLLAIGSGLAAAATAAVWIPDTMAATATLTSLLVLAIAAMVDVVEHRLPNGLVGLAAVPVIVAMAISWVNGDTGVVAEAAAGGTLVGGALLVTHLVSPAGMGFGDVKAATVLGGALGLIDTKVAVLGLLVGLFGAAAWALASRRRTIPLGPGLVVGATVALAVAKVVDLGVGA